MVRAAFRKNIFHIWDTLQPPGGLAVGASYTSTSVAIWSRPSMRARPSLAPKRAAGWTTTFVISLPRLTPMILKPEMNAHSGLLTMIAYPGTRDPL